jgi:hypothetical protein
MFIASDLNDNVPVFDRTSYTAVVNENATVIYYLKPFYISSILVSNFFTYLADFDLHLKT